MEPLDALKALANALRESQAKVIRSVGGEPFAGYSEQMKTMASALEGLQSELAPKPKEPDEPPPAPEPETPRKTPPAPVEVDELPAPVIAGLLQLAQVTTKDVVYHLGCGQGKLLVSAASTHHVHGRGIDDDAAHIAAARERINKARLRKSLSVTTGDPLAADVSPATVVFLTVGKRNRDLLPPLRRQLPPGARIVTHQGPVPGWQHDQELTVKTEDGHKYHLCLWLVAARAAPESSVGGMSDSAWNTPS